MKQFFVCFLLSFIAYFIGAMFQGYFWEPFKWNGDVKIVIAIIIMAVWVIPIIFNYLDGKRNFED